MEVALEFDTVLQRKVSNVINMCDVLELYSDLQKQYFLSIRNQTYFCHSKIEAFYRIYAYDLLRKLDISHFIMVISQIVQIVGIAVVVIILGTMHHGTFLPKPRFCIHNE